MKQPNDEAEFPQLLKDSEGKVVFVDFTASWCGPCQKLGPVFEKLASEHSDSAVFCKVDVDENERTDAFIMETSEETSIFLMSSSCRPMACKTSSHFWGIRDFFEDDQMC